MLYIRGCFPSLCKGLVIFMAFIHSLSGLIPKDQDVGVFFPHLLNNSRLQPRFIEWGAIYTFDKLFLSVPKENCSTGATQLLVATYWGDRKSI